MVYDRADVSVEQHVSIGYRYGDMSASTYYDYSIFIEGKPRETPKYANIVNPLDGRTWMWLAISLLSVIAVLYLVSLIERNSVSMVS